MRTYGCAVLKRRVVLDESIVVTGGSNADAIEVSFDAEWRKLAEAGGRTWAVFKRGHQSLQVECSEGDLVKVPSEMLTERGYIDLSFYGKGGGETLVSELHREAIYVAEGGPTSAEDYGGGSDGGGGAPPGAEYTDESDIDALFG